MMPEAGMEAEAANNGGGAHETASAARPAALSLLRYSPALVVFIIAVADVGRWADPDRALSAFIESTYGGAADLAGWDRAALERAPLSSVR